MQISHYLGHRFRLGCKAVFNVRQRVGPSLRLLLFLLLGLARVVADDLALRSELDAAVVAGTINDQPLRLLLDTGADDCAIDKQLIAAMGLARQGERIIIAPSGMTPVSVFGPAQIAIDGFQSVKVNPAGIELSRMNLGGLVSFDGLVGLDILGHHTVVISDGAVSFCDGVPAEFSIVKILTSGDQLSERADVPVSFCNSQDHICRVDTGMTSSCKFNEVLLKDLVVEGKAVRAGTAKSFDVKGLNAVDRYVLRELTVAGVRFRNVPVSVGRTSAIGLELLRHVNLALDFPRRQILIGKPPQDVVDRFAINASGMAVGFDAAEALKVLAIRPDSPAETAGVQPGDVIVQLDGRNPAELSIYDIHDILARDSKTISVVFCRGQDEHYIELPLQLPFEYPPNWAALDARQADFEKFLEKLESDPAPAAKP